MNYDKAAQIARVYGFSFLDSCQCGGTLKYKWKFGKDKLVIMPGKKKFTLNVIDLDSYTMDWDQLEETLQKHYEVV